MQSLISTAPALQLGRDGAAPDAWHNTASRGAALAARCSHRGCCTWQLLITADAARRRRGLGSATCEELPGGRGGGGMGC
jgi:hypothetical protein